MACDRDRRRSIAIGEVESETRHDGGEEVGSIEGEEPDGGLALVGDVGAHVDLGEIRRRGNGRQTPDAQVLHLERYEPHVCLVVEEVELNSEIPEMLGQEPSYNVGVEGPVGEQKISPLLCHDAHRSHRDRCITRVTCRRA